MNSAIPFSLFHFCNQTLTGYLARKKVWSYPRVCNSFIHPLYINPLTVSPAHELLASTCHASDQPLRIFPSEFTHSFLLFIDPSIIQNAPYFCLNIVFASLLYNYPFTVFSFHSNTVASPVPSDFFPTFSSSSSFYSFSSLAICFEALKLRKSGWIWATMWLLDCGTPKEKK